VKWCLKFCWVTHGHCSFKDFVLERKASQPPMEPAEPTGFWFKNTQDASSTLYMYFFANLTRTGSLHQGENPKQKQRGRPESTGRVACFADLHMPMIQRDDTQRFITLEQNVSVCVLHKNKYTSVHEYHPISQANRHLAQATAAKRWRASSGLTHCAWSVFPYPSFSICWHMLWARGVPPA